MKKVLLIILMVAVACSALDAQDKKKKKKKLGGKLGGLGAKLGQVQKGLGLQSEGSAQLEMVQVALILQVQAALGAVATAQSYIAEAEGQKELALKLQNTASALNGENQLGIDELQGAVDTIKETQTQQKEIFDAKKEMDGDKKKYYKAALVPYLTAAALTVKLSEPIKAYGDLAQAKIESIASNPMELLGIKKTLKTGMFVVKNVPKLIINIGKSSKGLLTYSKQNGLDVSEASSIEL